MLELRKEGLFCKIGNFYIDPWRPVDYALITHAHSDHAYPGHRNYLCHPVTRALLQVRLGQYNYQTLNWGETIVKNGVRISFHPAGHVAGSSQIRLEYKGEIWVVSGDYKLEHDSISGNFEPVACHTFISESTFGLPVYSWEAPDIIYKSMQDWVVQNRSMGITSVFFAYSLGKAQRVTHAIAPVTDKIYLHPTVTKLHETLLRNGIPLPDVLKEFSDTTKPDVVIAPLSVMESSWLKKCTPYRTAVCSGWMQIRGQARRYTTDYGFTLSDHADWKGLLTAIKETGASRIYLTHGFQSVMSRYLTEQGLDAQELKTPYGSEETEENSSTPTTTLK